MLSTKLIFIFATHVTLLIAAKKYTGPTNAAGINLIKEFEGFYPVFYNDFVGIRTIGYGYACHVLACDTPIYGKYAVQLTRSSATVLLKEDLKSRGGYEACVNNAISYNQLTSNQFSALVSFVYNMGCGNFRSSTLRNKVNRGHMRAAAGEFGKWVRAGGRRLNGLVRRRAAEKLLFCRGIAAC